MADILSSWPRDPPQYRQRPKIGDRQRQKQKYAETFTCDFPANPQYRNFEDRLNTFVTWNRNLDATPEQLSEAGFYYLGERDRCKCFYCNGGLQNWEQQDDPWYEHAKWFPNCEHVLQYKGFEYVEQINEQYPNLRRPVAQSPPQNRDYPEMLGPSLAQQPIRSPSPCNHADNMEMECETSCEDEKMDGEQDMIVPEDLIEQIRAFGFKDEIVQQVVKDKQQTGSFFQSLMEILEAVQEKEREIEENGLGLCQNPFKETHLAREVRADSTAAGSSTKKVVGDDLNNNEQLTRKRDLMSALDEVRCAVCRVNDRNCLLTSCGHLATCYDCGSQSTDCPICGRSISGNIHRVYKI